MQILTHSVTGRTQSFSVTVEHLSYKTRSQKYFNNSISLTCVSLGNGGNSKDITFRAFTN